MKKSLLILAGLSIFAGCGNMADQPKMRPYRESKFFEDGRSVRPKIEGTVARGQFHRDDDPVSTGKRGGSLVSQIPIPVDSALMARGQERYNIYCSVCHDRVGTGNGMIVQRGYPQPPSYHIDRLRQAPAGHFFDVISNGFARMPSQHQIPVRDRWAIVAYIRALQLSQNARIQDVPVDQRDALSNQP